MVHLPFADRLEAGRLLADQLSFHKVPVGAIVLALPRGGVPVGFAISERFDLFLDVVVVRKLGVPWQPELAMGAIAGSVRVLDERVIEELGIDSREIEIVARQEEAEIKRREDLYRGVRPPLQLRDRSVILVDDGLAMGSTMTAAARYVGSLNPARLTIAVPVGSRHACARLLREADDLVCLATPEPFLSVDTWYRDFEQVADAEVQNLLRKAHTARESHDSVCIS